jgi:Pyruvate kinase, barrel domain/Carbohydrate phosphorylase
MKKALPAHKTKIVATIGPASESPEMLERMLRAGVNIARLNFSHGDFSQHREIVRRIREAARSIGKRVAIMADLPGPKMRLGRVQVIRDGWQQEITDKWLRRGNPWEIARPQRADDEISCWPLGYHSSPRNHFMGALSTPVSCSFSYLFSAAHTDWRMALSTPEESTPIDEFSVARS